MTPVSGCRWCGIDEREHCQRWKAPIGWHGWIQPTQEQIKARMQTRKATRSMARSLRLGKDMR